MEFKDFILHEGRVYLGQKVGDILTAVHDLNDDAKSMGSKNLVRYSEKVVNQIRRILHQHWPREDTKYLKILQKIGVALMKAIEEKDDLENVVASVSHELESLVKKLGVPIHSLGVPEQQDQGPEPSGEENTGDPEHKIDKQSQQGMPPPSQQPGMPPGSSPAGPLTTGASPGPEAAPIGQQPSLGGF